MSAEINDFTLFANTSTFKNTVSFRFKILNKIKKKKNVLPSNRKNMCNEVAIPASELETLALLIFFHFPST